MEGCAVLGVVGSGEYVIGAGGSMGNGVSKVVVAINLWLVMFSFSNHTKVLELYLI